MSLTTCDCFENKRNRWWLFRGADPLSHARGTTMDCLGVLTPASFPLGQPCSVLRGTLPATLSFKNTEHTWPTIAKRLKIFVWSNEWSLKARSLVVGQGWQCLKILFGGRPGVHHLVARFWFLVSLARFLSENRLGWCQVGSVGVWRFFGGF